MTFSVYDGLIFPDKPTTEELGLLPMTIIYESAIIPGGTLPSNETIDGLAATYNSGGLPVAIDIEGWSPTDAPTVSEKYLPLVQRLYSTLTVPVGYYNVLPNHHAGIHPTSDNPDTRAQWRDLQDNNPQSQLFPYFDNVHCSFYRYEPLRVWQNRIRRSVKMIREVKPGALIIPFVWFRWHDSLAPEELRGTEIDRAEWRVMLETVRQICDGCILWGGYQEEWDGDAEWWMETQDWLAKYA